MMPFDLHNRDDEELVSLQLLIGEDSPLAPPLKKPINYQYWSYWSALSDSGYALSSPISEVGSSETSEELEDDDYITELARKMALNMLQDDDNHEQENKSCSNQEAELVMDQFEKEKVSEDVPKESDSERFASPSTQPASGSLIEGNPDFEYGSKQALVDKQIQFCTLKQERELKKKWGRKFNANKQNGIKGRACGGFPNGQEGAPWANLGHQRSSSRMNSDTRAGFLHNQTSPRTGCSGTGVFLPRNTTSDSRRKTGRPTILVPAKVLQALKLHFEKMGSSARPDVIDFQCQASQHRQSQDVHVPGTSDQEMGLPQEWTY